MYSWTSIKPNFEAHIFKWASSGFFCLINHEEKKVGIFYSKNCAKRLVSIVSDCKAGIYPNDDISRDITLGRMEYQFIGGLRAGQDKESVLISHVTTFLMAGYDLYKNIPKKKVKISIDLVKSEGIRKAVVHVSVTLGKKKTLVGVFKNTKDANDFIKKYYSKNTMHPADLYFSKSNLSKRFIK